jgi:hypothetical protein
VRSISRFGTPVPALIGTVAAPQEEHP